MTNDEPSCSYTNASLALASGQPSTRSYRVSTMPSGLSIIWSSLMFCVLSTMSRYTVSKFCSDTVSHSGSKSVSKKCSD